MARGAMRGAATGALSLIVLQGLTGKASGRVGGLVDAVTGLIDRAIDPNVPAIPDHSRTAGGSSSSSTTGAGTIPGAFDVHGNPIPTGLEHAGQTAQDLSKIPAEFWNTPGAGLGLLTPHPATRVRVPVNP